jgi:hypothetical protein
MRNPFANKWVRRGGKVAIGLILLDALAAAVIVAAAFWGFNWH